MGGATPGGDAGLVPRKLGAAIRRVGWAEARSDVRRFVPTVEQPGLDAWSTEFFLYQLEQLKSVMRGQ